MTLWSVHLDAIYISPVAVDAHFNATTEGFDARVVDKTMGLEVQPEPKGPRVPTLLPAACVRKSELLAKGVTVLATLVDTTVTFSGVTWKIINYGFRPSPEGETGGEIALYLRKA